ncbi:MAG: tetratricopeptide repeat protein [Fusobacteriota bacterium]
MKMVKIITFLTISFLLLGDNFYEDYKEANKFYENGNLIQGRYQLEKVLNEYKDYKEANVLYFKILYNLEDETTYEKIFEKILDLDNESKKEIYEFLLEKEDLEYLEKIYDSTEEKEEIKSSFLEILFDNQRYDKIINKYSTDEYIAKIESQKSKADNNYFTALDYLKKNDVNNSLILLKEAIKKYPFNYRYFLKIGQLYADKKSYNLAEINFKKALNFSDEDKIYLNLFRLYKRTNENNKLYAVSRHILDYQEVKEELKRLYPQNQINEELKILKKEQNKIFLSAYYEKDLEVGNTYNLGRLKDKIIDNKTGEVLYAKKEKLAKIRFFDSQDKILVFHVLEGTQNINLEDNYILY